MMIKGAFAFVHVSTVMRLLVLSLDPYSKGELSYDDDVSRCSYRYLSEDRDLDVND